MDVEEDGLFTRAPVIGGPDDVFATVLQFDTIDDKGVVIAAITLHELDTLLEFGVVVEPSDSGRCDGDDTTHELGALAFEGES